MEAFDVVFRPTQDIRVMLPFLPPTEQADIRSSCWEFSRKRALE